MQFVADLHLHSKYSRAVSKDMILPVMADWGRKKGLDILATGDWTHPLWLREIKGQLEERSEGIYGLKSADSPLFLLSTEISSIYKQNDKLRRIHNLVFVKDFETAEKVNKELVKRGCNLMSDGRPIIGLSSKNLLELVLSVDDESILVPCHVWTPHFGIYGSASGFDSIEEAFGDLSKNIYGIETGLSSDPEMNWKIKELEKRSILSFSDAHSPAKMGREATIFVDRNGAVDNASKNAKKVDISYHDISDAIKRVKSSNLKIGYTIEFFPEEGKYHFSGHRNCGISKSPEEIKKEGNICPSCKRKFTEGVLYRISQMGGKSEDEIRENKKNSNNINWFVDKTKSHPPFVKLVPLLEIVAESMISTVASQKVKTVYDNLCEEFGSEIEVLLKTPIERIEKSAGEIVAEGIKKVREGDIDIIPGFDNEYGRVKIWSIKEPPESMKKTNGKDQLGLF